MKEKYGILIFILLLNSAISFAQTTSTTPVPYEKDEFKQWVWDLRRFDVVTIGAFPFAFFTATFFTDTFRWAANNWDTNYAPWPLKPANPQETTDEEKGIAIGLAFVLAAAVAVVDLIVINIKRHKQAKKANETYKIEKTPIHPPVEAEATDSGG